MIYGRRLRVHNVVNTISTLLSQWCERSPAPGQVKGRSNTHQPLRLCNADHTAWQVKGIMEYDLGPNSIT